MILYIDERYENIIGNQGILRFLPDFTRFCDATEQYWDNDGNQTWLPGLDRLPYNICCFIDDSVDRIHVPFTGPEGDFTEAPRRREYMDAQ